MAVRYSCDVFCDECGNHEHIAVSDRPANKRKARKAVKAIGWVRIKTPTVYQDLCPQCAAALTTSGGGV